MKTSRNGIEVKIAANDVDMSAQIDAVYEICDAMLPSEKHVHDAALAIIAKHVESSRVIPRLTDIFLDTVKNVARAEGFMTGVPEENFRAVAATLAKDWDNTMGRDYRSSKDSNPSL